MQWRLVFVGEPSLKWAKSGIEDYLKRLQRMARMEMIAVKEGPRVVVEERLLAASEGTFRILMDERGKSLRSIELAKWIQHHEVSGTKKVSLVVGGADGHSERMRELADAMWSLSAMTLQHELALVVLLEQIYRAYSINRGDPYHREG
jgi:23S rRNA (pseudouridine1915-N3)-methyltransferase